MLRPVDFLELGGDFLGSIGGAVIDDNKLPLEVTIGYLVRTEAY